MKNQYFGDIGDYGKYGLLRFLRDSGVKVGVNWYLTPCDGRTDGSHTEYLHQSEMREYDPDLFDFLQPRAEKKDKSVSEIENEPLMDGITFYNRLMNFDSISDCVERGEERKKWHSDALSALSECELIFADPDNGLSLNKRGTQKKAQKYILKNEIKEYFEGGKQILYYQHRPYKSGEDWMIFKTMVLQEIPEARLLALSLNRWSCRTFIFVLHNDQYDRYSSILEAFLNTNWSKLKVGDKGMFTLEELSY